MKKIGWTYILGGILLVHSISGAILTFVKNPYGNDLNTCFMEAIAGAGLIKGRKATERLEKKVDDLE